MKPPFIRIIARCEKHGQFQVDRKPNSRRDTGSGKKANGMYDAVKCPRCPWWATIERQWLVTEEVAVAAVEDRNITLPGMEG